jgi:hypothetical protein
MNKYIRIETPDECKTELSKLFSEVGLSDNLDMACNKHPRELPCLMIVDVRHNNTGKDLYVLSYVYSDLSRESAYDANKHEPKSEIR